MLIVDAFKAWGHVFSPPLRRIFWKSLGLTIALLLVAWLALARTAQWLLDGVGLLQPYPWLEATAVFLAGAGLFIGIAFVIPPVSALVAGFFLDDAAEVVERDGFPQDAPGRPLPVGQAILYGARFAGLSLLVNLVALSLIFVPVVNVVAFFGANAYLLGREYFEMAAGRFRPMAEAAAMRRRHPGAVLAAGMLLAGLLAIPFANLLTPVFGIALMVHLHKRLSLRDPVPLPASPAPEILPPAGPGRA